MNRIGPLELSATQVSIEFANPAGKQFLAVDRCDALVGFVDGNLIVPTVATVGYSQRGYGHQSRARSESHMAFSQALSRRGLLAGLSGLAFEALLRSESRAAESSHKL